MLCVDGGSGPLAALPMASPGLVLNEVRKPYQAAFKAYLHRIMNAATLPSAWSAARRFADRRAYPWAVACLRADLDDMLTCFSYATRAERKAVRTTNAIERRFREVRRRTRPDGHLPGQDLHGPHPVRRLHPRKAQPGNRHPFPLTHYY